MSDRNHDIWEKWMQEKKSFKSLAGEYGLSAQRIREIVLKENQKFGTARTLRERFAREFAPFTAGMAQSAMSLNRMFNALMRAAPREALTSPKTFLEWFMEQVPTDFMDFGNLGPARISVLLKIQKQIQNTDGLKEKLLDNCEKIR